MRRGAGAASGAEQRESGERRGPKVWGAAFFVAGCLCGAPERKVGSQSLLSRPLSASRWWMSFGGARTRPRTRHGGGGAVRARKERRTKPSGCPPLGSLSPSCSSVPPLIYHRESSSKRRPFSRWARRQICGERSGARVSRHRGGANDGPTLGLETRRQILESRGRSPVAQRGSLSRGEGEKRRARQTGCSRRTPLGPLAPPPR